MTSDVKIFIDASLSVGEPFHCSSCNMACLSQKMVDEHTCDSSFDIQKVKTEFCDQVLEMCTADASENNSHQLTANRSLLNAVKREIKEEPKVIHTALENTKQKQCRKIKKKAYVQTSVNIAPKLMPAVNIIDPAVASLKLAAQSERKNALLKPKNSSVSESNIRIEQVFYTDPNQHQNRERQVPYSPAVVSRNLTLTNTTNCDTFSSLTTNMLSNTNMLSSTVVPNLQQSSFLLGSINSVQNVNSLQPTNIIQGLQNINFVPGIQGFQSLNFTQNTSLALHQTYTQDVNQSAHKPVVGIQASPSMPILIGNQIFLVNAATLQHINSSPAGSMQPPVMFTGSPAVSSLNQTSTGPDKSMSMEKESNFFTEKFRYKSAEKRKRSDREFDALTPVTEEVVSRTSDNLLDHDSNSNFNNKMIVNASNNLPIQNEAAKTIANKSSKVITDNKLTSTSNFTTSNLVKQTEQMFNSLDLPFPSNVSQSPMVAPLVQQTSFILPHQPNANFLPTTYPFPGNFLNLVNNPGLIISNAHNDLQKSIPSQNIPIQNITNSNCSITGNIAIVSSISNPLNVQPGLLSSQATTVKSTFVSISPKVVPSTAKIKESASGMVVPMRILPKTLKSFALGNKESLKINEEHPATTSNLSTSNNSRKMATKFGPNTPIARSEVCINQLKKKRAMPMPIKPLDKSSRTSESLKVHSVGDKKMLPTLTGLHPDLQDLFDKEFGGGSTDQSGRVLVGPLTKTELDDIMKNPAELKKYVNIPTDQVVIASKALAVSNMSKSCYPFDSNSKLLQGLNDKGVPIKISDNCSKFIQVLPKTDKTMLSTSGEPSESISFHYKTTNDGGQVLMEQNQVSIPSSESTAHSSTSSDQKKMATKINISSGAEETKKKEIRIMPKKINEIEIINTDSSQAKRYQTYELADVKQDPLNGLMRLSFEGDIKLLKDSLRRTTVPLHKLSCGLTDIVKIKRAKFTLASVPVHSNVKYTIKGLQTVTILDQNIPKKRKLLHCNNHPTQKQWVPTEVIGDLKMNGQILEGPICSRMKDNGKRKSLRINGKPIYKYTDNDISLSDEDFELELARIGSFKNCNEGCETQEHVEDASIINNISFPVEDLYGSNKQDLVQSNESRPCEQISNVSGDIILETVLMKQELLLTESRSKDENAQNVIEKPPVSSSETQESNIINNEHGESCYNSSESDSDMSDLDTDVLSKGERKKLMLKQHNEVTMFLIKNSSKFSSREENEHYCNICNRYKTTGIFNLSKHLKKHLQGLLKCSKCSFEAWNEDALNQHLVKHG